MQLQFWAASAGTCGGVGGGKEDAGGVGGWFLSRQFYVSQSSAEEKHL